MRKTHLSILIVTAIGSSVLFCSGCTPTRGLTAAPVFPPPTLDYSSQLQQQRAQQTGSPYLPPGGFGQAPAYSPMFSPGPGGRSGSC
ncbi:hypothetical protein [Mariniblastus fucicola]|uniref:Lipoprotein n=1 Tax=Mariniblastus fucicola TaxID=980251 RepID=A0A5B9P2C4_9BACT|nr:hypothetical protein [Mariniblastus fucicola]QEG20488.1 hypothetical protein MFFC18_03360 [Mariniblastus fucicola]